MEHLKLAVLSNFFLVKVFSKGAHALVYAKMA